MMFHRRERFDESIQKLQGMFDRAILRLQTDDPLPLTSDNSFSLGNMAIGFDKLLLGLVHRGRNIALGGLVSSGIYGFIQG